MYFSDLAFDDFGADAPATPAPDLTAPRANSMEDVMVDPRIAATVMRASPDARRMLVPARALVMENRGDGFVNRAMKIPAGGLTLQRGDWVPVPGHNHPSVAPFNLAGLLYLVFQADGNVVLYKLKSAQGDKEALWATGARGDKFLFQDDGNLVLYQGASAVWSSGTHPRGENGVGKWLGIQSDGNICVYGAVENMAVYPHGEPRWCCCFGHGHTPGFWDDVLTVLTDIGIVVGTFWTGGGLLLTGAAIGSAIYQGASGGNVLNVNEIIRRMPAITAAPVTLTADALTGGSGFQWTLEHPLETLSLEIAASGVIAGGVAAGVAIAGGAGAGAAGGGISAGGVGSAIGAAGAAAGAVGTVARVVSGGGGGSTTPTQPGTAPAGQPGAVQAGILGGNAQLLLWGGAALLALILFGGKRR